MDYTTQQGLAFGSGTLLSFVRFNLRRRPLPGGDPHYLAALDTATPLPSLAQTAAKAPFKLARYAGLVRTIRNWPAYLLWKAGGRSDEFVFDIRGLGQLAVKGRALGPFRENFFDDVYYSRVPKHLRDRFGEAPVILDVGANVGYFALASFLRYPRAKVISFEPHPYCLDVLDATAARFGQYDWHIDRTALSDHGGEGTLNTNLVADFTSISSIGPDDRNTASIPIMLQTLDEAIFHHGLTHVDLAKFDCEGGEYPTLYGATPEVLAKLSVLCIETHKNPAPRYNQKDLNRYLLDLGFETDRGAESRDADLLYAWRA